MGCSRTPRNATSTLTAGTAASNNFKTISRSRRTRSRLSKNISTLCGDAHLCRSPPRFSGSPGAWSRILRGSACRSRSTKGSASRGESHMKLGMAWAVLQSTLLLTAMNAQENGVPREVQTALGSFSKAALRAHMQFLADDLLEGRGTGTRGQEIAAKYVAAEFQAAGLEPAGGHGGYLEPVPLREIQVQPEASEVAIVKDGHATPLKWGVDYVTRGNELRPDSSVEAPVVFVGFGVVDRALKYDDYASLNVKGKIVAVLFGAPATFPSEERAHFASGVEKAREAAARGAVGILALRTPETDALLPWNRSVIGAEMPAFR